jgi:membrane protease YdiL (CAAX protease family)
VEFSKKDYPEPIEALVVILVTFGIIFGAILIIAIVALFLEKSSIMSSNSSLMFVLGGFFFILIPVFYVRLRQYDLRRVFRLKPVPLGITLIGIPIGLSLAILSDGLDRIVRLFFPPPEIFTQYLESMRAETMTDWFLLVLGVIIIASFSEEMLFRGFLQLSLEKKGDINRAVIMSSLTWTLIHINPYWAIQIFITGVILGFLAWRADSIYPAIIVHAINNLLSLLAINFDLESSLDWYLWGDQVSPLIIIPMAGVLVFCLRYMTVYYQRNK